LLHLSPCHSVDLVTWLHFIKHSFLEVPMQLDGKIGLITGGGSGIGGKRPFSSLNTVPKWPSPT
jgi:hypothetical protein